MLPKTVLKVEPFLTGWPPRRFDAPVIAPQIGRYPMLVLTRKIGEKIWIGNHVVLTVVKCGSNNIKLAIEAPLDVTIVRDELCRKPEEGLTSVAER